MDASPSPDQRKTIFSDHAFPAHPHARRPCYDPRHPTTTCSVETPTMNKSELIEAVAAKTELTKAAAGRAVEMVLDTIAETVAKGDTVSVIGFGSFEARKRAARTGKNPQTGEGLKIAASTVPAFKAGKAFKDRVASAAGKKGVTKM